MKYDYLLQLNLVKATPETEDDYTAFKVMSKTCGELNSNLSSRYARSYYNLNYEIDHVILNFFDNDSQWKHILIKPKIIDNDIEYDLKLDDQYRLYSAELDDILIDGPGKCLGSYSQDMIKFLKGKINVQSYTR